MRSDRFKIRAFLDDEDGVFAVLFGLMAIVLFAMAGAVIDYVMWMAAQNAAQDAADAGVLAAAASSVQTDEEVEGIIAGFANPMLERWDGLSLAATNYDPVSRRVSAEVRGNIPTYFVQLVGVAASGPCGYGFFSTSGYDGVTAH